MNDRLTHAYVHRLADVHLAGFAPAFPLSFHDRKFARKPPVPIASVVSSKFEKRKETKIAYNFNEEIWLQIVEKDQRITAVRIEITWKVLSEKTIVKNSLIMIVCVVKNSYFYAWVNKVRVKRLKEQTESFKEH